MHSSHSTSWLWAHEQEQHSRQLATQSSHEHWRGSDHKKKGWTVISSHQSTEWLIDMSRNKLGKQDARQNRVLGCTPLAPVQACTICYLHANCGCTPANLFYHWRNGDAHVEPMNVVQSEYRKASEPHQKKEDWTMPIVAVSQPNCSAIGRMAMLMFTRSMLHSMNATKHNPMIVQRRFHRPALPNTCRYNMRDTHEYMILQSYNQPRTGRR